MALVSFAATFKDNKVLLVKLNELYEHAYHWNFPGGGVEAGETLAEGAKREVLEETGITIKVGEVLESFTSPKHEVTIFLAEYESGEIVVQSSELLDAKWYALDEAVTLPLAYDIKQTLINLKKIVT